MKKYDYAYVDFDMSQDERLRTISVMMFNKNNKIEITKTREIGKNKKFFPVKINNVEFHQVSSDRGNVDRLRHVLNIIKDRVNQVCIQGGTEKVLFNLLSTLGFDSFSPITTYNFSILDRDMVIAIVPWFDFRNRSHLALFGAKTLQDDWNSKIPKSREPNTFTEKETFKAQYTESGCMVKIISDDDKDNVVGEIIRENGKSDIARFNREGKRIHNQGEIPSIGDNLVTERKKESEVVESVPVKGDKETKYVILYLNSYGETVTSRVFDTEEQAVRHAKRHNRVLTVCGISYENPYI